jgi:hypothetical protein
MTTLSWSAEMPLRTSEARPAAPAGIVEIKWSNFWPLKIIAGLKTAFDNSA